MWYPGNYVNKFAGNNWSATLLEVKKQLALSVVGEHVKPGEAMLIFNKTVEIILVFHHLTG